MVSGVRGSDPERGGQGWNVEADTLVQTGRRRVVVALGTARAELTASPAHRRDEIQAELVRRLKAEATTFTHSATKYAAAAATNRGDASTEFEARRDQCRAFAVALDDIGQSRPWLAALSTTADERVHTNRLDDLQAESQWRLAQRVSIEATVLCMPPATHSWSAAEGQGNHRLNDLEADVTAWRDANQRLPRLAESDLMVSGGLRRDDWSLEGSTQPPPPPMTGPERN